MPTLTLTEAERKVLAYVLDISSSEFANHGCNDLDLVREVGLGPINSFEFRKTLQKGGDYPDDAVSATSHIVMDWMVMGYWSRRIAELPDDAEAPSSLPVVPRATAKEFTEATDALNLSIERVEATLEVLGLGIKTEIPLYTDREWPKLGYAKIGKHWTLYTLQAVTVQREPLTRAPRNVRVQALYRLGALFEELTTAAEEQTKEIRKAIASVDALLGRVQDIVPDED